MTAISVDVHRPSLKHVDPLVRCLAGEERFLLVTGDIVPIKISPGYLER